MRPGFGSEERPFRWGLFILLLVLYALFLNPRCWPKHQVPGVRYPVSGGESAPVVILRHQRNPYAEPQLKLIALNGQVPGGRGQLSGQNFSGSILNRQSKIANHQWAASPQTAGPHNADQVLLQVYDALNGALKGNAIPQGGSGGNTNPTPHNADQVFLAVYDPVNGAIRVNIIAQSLQAVLGGPNEVPFFCHAHFQPCSGERTGDYAFRPLGACRSDAQPGFGRQYQRHDVLRRAHLPQFERSADHRLNRGQPCGGCEPSAPSEFPGSLRLGRRCGGLLQRGGLDRHGD